MTEGRKDIRNRRNRARKNALDSLLRRQRYKCHWCGKRIVRVRDLQNKEGVVINWQSGELVEWVEGGRTHHRRVATVDHVTPLARGGANTQDNLVASCAPCNQGRRES